MLPVRLRLLKKLDGLLGRMLVRRMRPAAGAGVRSESDEPHWVARPIPVDEVRRILVIRPGGIGDAVLMYPMLRALQRHFQAPIDVLGERRNASLYRVNRLVESTFTYDLRPWALRALQKRNYDLVVDTEQYHHLSVILANHLRPKYLCGFDTLGRGRFQTHRVRYSEHYYEAHSFLDLASAVIGRKQPFDPDEPFLDVDVCWQDWARENVPINGRLLAAMVPTASSAHRFWAPERYAAVARWLIERGYHVGVRGGRDAVDPALRIKAGFSAEDLSDLAGRTSLPQAAGVVSRAALYVSADTGMLHIAYGVGTPTVHMFGSGIQEKWAPPGRRYVVVNKRLPCSPCTRYGSTPPCLYAVACMDAIGVGDVTSAIEGVLEECRSSTPILTSRSVSSESLPQWADSPTGSSPTPRPTSPPRIRSTD